MAERRRVLDSWGAVCGESLESLQAIGAFASIKTLSLVVKNVVAKGGGVDGAKYRTLRKSNAKVAATVGAYPAAVALLMGLGFAEADGELVLGADFDAPLLAFAAQQLAAAAAACAESAGASGTKASAPARINPTAAASAAPSAADLAKMSMKQKARYEQEQRQKRERADVAAEKAELLQRLEMDKKARKAEGWSATGGGSGVHKSGGKAIGTFRERFGEEPGG